MSGSNLKKILLLAIIAVLFFLGYKYEVYNYITAEYIEGVVNQFGMFAPVAFMVIYYLAIVFLLPASVFTVIAGLLFGPYLGTFYVVIAATLAAQTAFMISKYLGDGLLDKLGSQSTIIKSMVDAINKQLESGGLRAFIVLRALFLPYMPLSYAAGLVKEARGRDFFLGTLITNMMFSPAFVVFGDALKKDKTALIIPVVLIIVVLLVPKIVKRFQKKK